MSRTGEGIYKLKYTGVLYREMDKNEIEVLRDEIDIINKQLAELGVRRLEHVENIGEIKEKEGMDVKDSSREEDVVQQFREVFSNHEFPEEYGERLANCLMDMAKDLQREKR